MDTLRSIVAVLTVIFAVGAGLRTLRQPSPSRSTDAVLVIKLLGMVLLTAFACTALFWSSWKLLGLGYALYATVAATGFDLTMIVVSPSTRRHALLHLVQNLPWWSGLLVSLVQAQWIPLLVGTGASVLLYLILSPARTESAARATSVRTGDR